MFQENLPMIVVTLIFCTALYLVYRDMSGLKTRISTIENAARASAEMYRQQQQQALAANQAMINQGFDEDEEEDDEDEEARTLIKAPSPSTARKSKGAPSSAPTSAAPSKTA